jgi:hypothetical protein
MITEGALPVEATGGGCTAVEEGSCEGVGVGSTGSGDELGWTTTGGALVAELA